MVSLFYVLGILTSFVVFFIVITQKTAHYVEGTVEEHDENQSQRLYVRYMEHGVERVDVMEVMDYDTLKKETFDSDMVGKTVYVVIDRKGRKLMVSETPYKSSTSSILLAFGIFVLLFCSYKLVQHMI